MSILFEPTSLKNITLRNRFVRSATYDGSADQEGHVSDQQVEIFKQLARGGVGLIVTGITYIHPSGQIVPFQNSIAGDDHIPGFKGLTAAVHSLGASIAIQLFHAGREAAAFLKGKNEQAIAPSFVEEDPYFAEKYRPMRDEEIWEIVRSFGDAARRAREAGFDAVQLHGAHGYLLSQFLSPYANRRDDDWGGTLEKRLRFFREVHQEIRTKVGEDFPVLIKIGVKDEIPGGLELWEGKLAVQFLVQWGFDALEISQGLRGLRYENTEFRRKIDHIDREAYFRDWCGEIRRQVNVPTIIVGGLRTYSLMEDVVQKGEADLVALSRPLIREPGIINAWRSGDHRRAACISCNGCLEALRRGQPLHCVQQKGQAHRWNTGLSDERIPRSVS
jgi:2,4-dienoyl-CoA reductase-like NADH-dependent reductase (Old Yellow Enzyme family)